MFSNFIKIFFRNIRKHKLYAIINILGLSVGISVCILIFLYVKNETSYDTYHEKADQIFRIERYGIFDGEDYHYPNISAQMGDALKNEYPEILERVRFRPYHFKLQNKHQNLQNERLIAADNNLFDVFSFRLLIGDEKTALENPYSIVLTQAMADKYLQEGEYIGQTLTVMENNHYYDFIVTGIMEDIPEQSHFHPSFFFSFSTIKDYSPDEYNDWISMSDYTYLLLDKNSDPDILTTKFSEFMKKYFVSISQKLFGEDLISENNKLMNLKLRSIKDIYLHSKLTQEIDPVGNIDQIYIMIAVGIVILLIACMNFINLSIAQSLDRTKEISLRKILGASQLSPFFQLITESVIISLIAMFLSLLIVELVLPIFNNFTQKNLVFFSSDISIIPLIIAFSILIGFVSGIYPAYYITSFDPAKVLKSIQRTSTGGFALFLRKFLIVCQFTISIILIFATIVVTKQMNFLLNRDMGFDKDNIIDVSIDDPQIEKSLEAVKTDLLQHPNIIKAATSSSNLGRPNYNQPSVIRDGQGGNEVVPLNLIDIDDDFLNTLGLKIIAGRNFSESFGSDQNSNSIIINESAVKTFNWNSPDEALGDHLNQLNVEKTENDKRQIIGVVKDFNFSSMYSKIQPLAFTINKKEKQHLYLKIIGSNILSTLSVIEKTLKKFSSKYVFKYTFQDEHFAALHKKEDQQKQIFTICAILAILIASLGLFALSTYMIKLQTKELGIRKILGATSVIIWQYITLNFIQLVVVAILLSWPISFLVMNKWLENFAYRIGFSITPFIVSGIIALGITILAVSWQAVKAAKANPIESLKYE